MHHSFIHHLSIIFFTPMCEEVAEQRAYTRSSNITTSLVIIKYTVLAIFSKLLNLYYYLHKNSTRFYWRNHWALDWSLKPNLYQMKPKLGDILWNQFVKGSAGNEGTGGRPPPPYPQIFGIFLHLELFISEINLPKKIFFSVIPA